MRIAQVIAVAWLILLGVLVPVHAEKRVALVVGNGAYHHADKLANPVNDAQGMRTALTRLGFDIIYGEDLDNRGLRRAVGQFADRVQGADVALVYFAGHGVTFGDTPYVVPVDAEFSSVGQVAYELIPVETLIGELRQVKGVRIAILDACRDNAAEQALKRQGARGGAVTRGLAPMKNLGGLIIAYATQYLSTAADDASGAGVSASGHSPFTAALLNNIATPGLDVKDMFYKVGREVNTASGGRQQPEISVSMYEQYALAPAAAKPETVRPVEAAPPAASPPVSEAAQTWGIIQNTTSLAVLDDFIRQFGNTPVYGSLARARREELAKEQGRDSARTAASGVPSPTPPVNVSPVNVPPVNIPPVNSSQADSVNAVRAFYAALSQGDGVAAAALIVPEKRGTRNYNPAEMTKFWSSLRRRLAVQSIQPLDDSSVAVTYNYAGPTGKACDATATVKTTRSGGTTLIQSISTTC